MLLDVLRVRASDRAPLRCPRRRPRAAALSNTRSSRARLAVPHQSVDAPLDEVVAQFYQSFSKSDHFKVGCVVCILLEDNMLARAEVRGGRAGGRARPRCRRRARRHFGRALTPAVAPRRSASLPSSCCWTCTARTAAA